MPPPTGSKVLNATPVSLVSFCALQIELEEKAPEIDFYFNRGKSLEDLFSGLTFPKTTASTGTQSSSCSSQRGRRKMSEITIQTFVPAGNSESDPKTAATTTETATEEQSADSKESSPGATSSVASSAATGATAHSSSAEPNPDQIKFVSGNPFVEVTKGILHLYKENQTTSLEEGVIRSQMMCKSEYLTKHFFSYDH